MAHCVYGVLIVYNFQKSILFLSLKIGFKLIKDPIMGLSSGSPLFPKVPVLEFVVFKKVTT